MKLKLSKSEYKMYIESSVNGDLNEDAINELALVCYIANYPTYKVKDLIKSIILK